MADPRAPENRSSGKSASLPSAIGPTHGHASSKAQPLTGFRLALLALLYVLPKNAVSRMAGRFASLRWPGPIQRFEIRLFARLAGVDLTEARDPIESFASLQSFFVRALREGVRKMDGGDRSLVSPCDGAWGEAGRVELGTLVQVKGKRYSLGQLLGDEDLPGAYEGGFFATFYLSPRNYHRFHTPAAGWIRRIEYHPGSLWPVNSIGLKGVDRLFARNERICAYLDPRESSSEGAFEEVVKTQPPIVLVPVGATMVGSIRLTFDDLTTNKRGRHSERRDLGQSAPYFERGEEWGHFEFGSTIVMLTPPGRYRMEPRPVGEPIRLGQVIGQVCD